MASVASVADTVLTAPSWWFVVAGVMVQIVMAFSPLSNGAKILSCELQEEDSLTAVHGLRFLSLAWVIMVHTYLQVFAIAGTSQTRRPSPG